MVALAKNGFSLIEVLISLFILSVGVLASAGMQMAAARSAHDSALQTRAVHFAAEIADMLRADIGAGKECSDTSACLTSASAQSTLESWTQRVARDLPDGRAIVCQDASPWDAGSKRFSWACSPSADERIGSLVVKVGWRDRSEKEQDGPQLVMNVQPFVP